MWVNAAEPNALDVHPVVGTELQAGNKVNVVSGIHGSPNGSVLADAKPFFEDQAWYANPANNPKYPTNVNVYDFTKLTPEEFTQLIQGPRPTVCAWCHSDATQQVLQALGLAPK